MQAQQAGACQDCGKAIYAAPALSSEPYVLT